MMFLGNILCIPCLNDALSGYLYKASIANHTENTTKKYTDKFLKGEIIGNISFTLWGSDPYSIAGSIRREIFNNDSDDLVFQINLKAPISGQMLYTHRIYGRATYNYDRRYEDFREPSSKDYYSGGTAFAILTPDEPDEIYAISVYEDFFKTIEQYINEIDKVLSERDNHAGIDFKEIFWKEKEFMRNTKCPVIPRT